MLELKELKCPQCKVATRITAKGLSGPTYQYNCIEGHHTFTLPAIQGKLGYLTVHQCTVSTT